MVRRSWSASAGIYSDSQPGMRWLLSANALLLLVLGILPAPLMSICFAAIVTL